MSQENVEIVRRMERVIAGDDPATAWSAITELLHPEIEMDTTRVPALGLKTVSRGIEQVGRWWASWLEAWGTLGQWEPSEVIDAGDQVLVWTSQHELRGKGSGIGVAMPEYGWVMELRERKIVRATFYEDKEEALQAAGLRE